MEEITNVPVQEPETTVKPKKKLFGKPEIFMLIVLICGNGISSLLSYISTLIVAFIPTLNNFLQLPSFITDILSDLTSSVSYYIRLLLPVAVIIVFAYLAYKKIRKAARFVGVAFIATEIASLIYTALAIIPGLISTIFYDSVATVIFTVLLVIMDICKIVLAAAIGVVLLMIVEGKIKFKKKAKPETAEVKEAE